jgi:hypothetical protein
MTPRATRLFLSLLAALPLLAAADEGMWTVDNVPAAKVKEEHRISLI